MLFREDGLVTIIVLDNLSFNQCQTAILNIFGDKMKTYNKVGNQSMLLIDPRFEVEKQELDVTVLDLVLGGELLGLHPTLVVTQQVKPGTVLAE